MSPDPYVPGLLMCFFIGLVRRTPCIRSHSSWPKEIIAGRTIYADVARGFVHGSLEPVLKEVR